MQEQNFRWLVEHITLRVSIAERASTRSFTAAVFAVAVIAVIRDLAEFALTVNQITFNAYRGMVAGLGSGAVLVLTALIYVVARRLIK